MVSGLTLAEVLIGVGVLFYIAILVAASYESYRWMVDYYRSHKDDD